MNSLNYDLRDKLKRLNVFEKIIILNVCIYVIGWSLFAFNNVARNNSLDWLSLPEAFSGLLDKPWSVITYAFAHLDFWHLALNMMVLYFIGRSLANLFNPNLALSVYIYGILAGALAFLLVNTFSGDIIIKDTDGLVGASAAIRASLLFLAFYMPNYEVQLLSFKFPLKYVAYFIIAIDILGLWSTNAGGYVSHLGGDIIGFIYASQLLKGNDIGLGLQRIIKQLSSLFKLGDNKHLKTVYKKDKKFAGMSKEEFSTYNNQKKIDLILDKISKSGYESLTAEEKEFLFRAGKNN